MTSDAVLERLAVDAGTGLATGEARRRRRRHGLNRLQPRPPKRALRILFDQLGSLIVMLLAAAAAVALLYGHVTEGLAIGAVIVLNTAIGFATELRAVRSMEALRALSVHTVNVRRGGRVTPIPARGLVPGDIVVLDAGDVVGADMRLVEASRLQCNESILTGESLPVAKGTEPVDADAVLPERSGMLYLGTSITRGAGVGVVTATGDHTELGGIARLVEQAEPAPTPLEQRIDHLSRQLMWIALVLAALVGASGVASGRDLLLMVQSAIALAVATVPEGLPMVATLALARGMWRMARRNALIERLPAVETLGATTVILTDKTGTLTRNEMAVAHMLLADGGELDAGDGEAPVPRHESGSVADRALAVAALCNNASLAGGDAVGEPMEVALLRFAARHGVDREAIIEEHPEVAEVAFDPQSKMMATVHRLDDGGFLYAVKGAPESVIEHVASIGTGNVPCSEGERAAWRARADALAAQGLRVLVLAGKVESAPDLPPYRDLALYAMVGFSDPPREDVAEAVCRCRDAGVRVVMVTGDHAATARGIAVAVGLADEHDTRVIEGAAVGDGSGEPADAPIYARVTPAQKLHVLEAFQRRGEIVAMTGDGVNDAPALRQADIGIAMGLRGSQVAREAADMVLLDDRFHTIVTAIAQGRAIFDNIRKFVVYLMSCNVSELLVIGLASLAGAPLPLLPLQVLYLNLVTDVFPAFALGASEGERDIMRRGPRPPSEALLTPSHWLEIALGAAVITAATLCAFALGLTAFELPPERAVTLSFLTLALAQLWHVFNMRSPRNHWLRNEVTRNRWVWAAVGLCLGLILIPVYLPALGSVLGLSPPPAAALAVCLGLSLVPLLAGQIVKSRAPVTAARPADA